jgi:hypothetical protein
MGNTHHVRDGLMLQRLEDGTVLLRTPGAYETRIPPAEWASAVASVSKDGETPDTWYLAMALHEAEPPRGA